MADDLFRVSDRFDLRHFLSRDEQVCCVDGSSSILTVGTTRGRILCVKISGNTLSPESAISLNQNSPVSQIVLASALDRLLALNASKLYIIEKEARRAQHAPVNAKINAFALNTNPTVDNPFILQLAVATNEKQVIAYNLCDENLTVEHKITVDCMAVSLCYNRRCICFATLSAYYVYHLPSNSARILFSYDSTVTRPLIISVNVDEFLVNGVQGLGVFATSSGGSSRPPIVWGSEKILAIVCRLDYVFVLNMTSLIVYSIAGSIDEVQRLHVENGHFLYNIDGRIMYSANDQLCTVEEVDWSERAEQMFAKNEIEEALSIAEEAVCETRDEQKLWKLNHLQEKCAVRYFQMAEFDKCCTLAHSSKMDPRKLIVYYEDLLPLSSGFEAREARELEPSLTDIPYSDPRYFDFLEGYLRQLRNLQWTEEYCRDIDVTLIRLMALRGQSFDGELYSSCKCSYEDCENWLKERGFSKCLVFLAIYSSQFDSALQAYSALSPDQQADADLLKEYIANISRISNKETFLKTLKCLVEVDAIAVFKELDLQLLEKYADEIIAWLENQRDVQISFLENLKCLKKKELDTKLLVLYIHELAPVAKTGEPETPEAIKKSYRIRLRNLLFESDVYDGKEVLSQLENAPWLEVERVLLEAREGNAGESCLQKLLEAHKDFDSAELLCTHLGASCPNLYRILLKFYIRAAKGHPKFDSRISNLLSSMDATTTADLLEIFGELPDDWLFRRLSAYTAKTVLVAENRKRCNALRNSSLIEALKQLSRDEAIKSRKSVVVDESTKCSVCNDLLGGDDLAYSFQSETFVHRICMK